jgi:hypothetical protein
MASITLKEEMTTASAELRAAVEQLKISRDTETKEEQDRLQQCVDAAKQNLLATVTKLSSAQDQLEQTNPSSIDKKIPVEKVLPSSTSSSSTSSSSSSTATPSSSTTSTTSTTSATNIEMEVDSSQYHSIKIIPKTDEATDRNFPPSLLAAMELFSKLKMINHGRELQKSVETFCVLLESGPPVEAISMGVANVCWNCGHVGLPSNVAEITKAAPATASREELSKAGVVAVCSKCNNNTQTNLIRVTQPDGSMIPWIESKGETKKKAEEARKKMMEEGRTPDEVVGAKKGKKMKPNEKCHCGSGKKFKKCCR